MGFLYFVPGRESVRAADARELGLGHVWQRSADPIVSRACREGPGETAGAVVARTAEGIGYYPDRQQWRRIPNSECWVGMFTDQRPSPAELVRDVMIDGHNVADAFDQAWQVPAARRWVEQEGQLAAGCGLPLRFALGADGQWLANDVHARHRRLWELAIGCEDARTAAFFEAAEVAAEGVEEISYSYEYAKMDALAVEAIATNYLVGPAELDLIEVYDAEFRNAVVEAVLDLPTWSDWCKKKERRGDGSRS